MPCPTIRIADDRTMPAFLRTPGRIRRMRLVAIVFAVMSATVVFATTSREFGYIGPPNIAYKSASAGWYVAIGDGCLKIGIIDPQVRNRLGIPGLYCQSSWRNEWVTAWRPFHVDNSGNMGYGIAKFLVIPLWPMVLVTIALAAWAQGALSALSILRSRSCRVCGYDLSGCKDSTTPCPECGHAR